MKLTLSEMESRLDAIMFDSGDGMVSDKTALINEAQGLFVDRAPCIKETIHVTMLPTFASEPTYQKSGALGSVTMSGGGIDDMAAYGLYTGGEGPTFIVLIDTEGATDKFSWSNDGGDTYEATGVDITGAEQLLENGVYIKFTATTGHTAGNSWTFKPIDITVTKDEARGDGVYIYKISDCIGIEDIRRVDSAAADDAGPDDERQLPWIWESFLDTHDYRELTRHYPEFYQYDAPDRFLIWAHPAATDDLTIEILFRRFPKTLVGDNDVSLIPPNYHEGFCRFCAQLHWEGRGQTKMAGIQEKYANIILDRAIRQHNCLDYEPQPSVDARYF